MVRVRRADSGDFDSPRKCRTKSLRSSLRNTGQAGQVGAALHEERKFVDGSLPKYQQGYADQDQREAQASP